MYENPPIHLIYNLSNKSKLILHSSLNNGKISMLIKSISNKKIFFIFLNEKYIDLSQLITLIHIVSNLILSSFSNFTHSSSALKENVSKFNSFKFGNNFIKY